jgi:uncharacterized membrane protein (Fun14 family)
MAKEVKEQIGDMYCASNTLRYQPVVSINKEKLDELLSKLTNQEKTCV